MYFDITYLIFVLPCAIFAMWANQKVNVTFQHYKTVYSRNQLSAYEVCRKMLDANGLYNVQIEKVSGHLTDHYDPRTNVIRLSDSVYHSTSVASIGVACHEAGHAIQYATNYSFIKLRNAIIPITNIGSQLSIPLILIGFLFPANGVPYLSYIGLACFFFAVLFQLFTLPTEFDASKRALQAIEQGQYLYADEIQGSKAVLQAAALTYVAALATALGQFLRLFVIIASHTRRDDE